VPQCSLNLVYLAVDENQVVFAAERRGSEKWVLVDGAFAEWIVKNNIGARQSALACAIFLPFPRISKILSAIIYPE
jgi:hypothetical protein